MSIYLLNNGVEIADSGIVSSTGQTYVEAKGCSTSLNNNTYTTLVYDTEYFDTRDEYDHTTGIFTASEAGIYLATYSALLDAEDLVKFNYFMISLSKNNSVSPGSLWTGLRHEAEGTQSATHLNSVGSVAVQLSAGNTLRVKGWQTTGGTVVINDNEGYDFLQIVQIS
jgi:hypothetical protein